MRTSSSRPNRIPPVSRENRSEELSAVLLKATKDPQREVNIYSTFVHRPELYEKWLELAHALLFHGTLTERDRELLVLRTAWNCDAEYEWGQHLRFARAGGISEEEIIAIENGPEDPIWDEKSQLLLAASDELHDRSTISNRTWDALAEYFDQGLLYEITMVVGTYHLVAMMLNSFGVQLDPEVPGRTSR
ncbi:carboxymuconolactone decarboxylase family protein [Micrococcaceae sp. AOP34-BR2-30]